MLDQLVSRQETTRACDPAQVAGVLDQVYAWSRGQGYRGFNKHDGLNSPILRVLLRWAKWPRILAIQGVTRFPVNLRPLLLVPKTYNPKGLALFARGLLDRYCADSKPAHLEEAESLLKLLWDLRAPGNWSGDCWGYQYPWQDLGFFAPAGTPNAVVTSFVCSAFLEAFQVTGKAAYLDTVGRSARFFLNDLVVLKDQSDELCLSYMPMPMRMRVLDVSILIGAVLARHARLSGDGRNLDVAHRLVAYVVNRQTSCGAWFYTDPPGDSPIRHDNYHTGFILDALADYMDSTGEHTWQAAQDAGLAYYRDHLFSPDGAPRWMNDREYPHDIHGAAQGILTFSRSGGADLDLAWRTADWALGRMYDPAGRFYYQENRWYRKRFTLLRWCNAWMARALAQLLRVQSGVTVRSSAVERRSLGPCLRTGFWSAQRTLP